VAAIPGVARVTPQFFAQTLSEACCDVSATRLIGFDPGSDWLTRSWVKNLPGGTLGPDQVLLGSGVTGVNGKTVTILGKQFQVAAVLDPTATSLDNSIMMPIDTARSVAKTSPYPQLFWGKWGDPQVLFKGQKVSELSDDAKSQLRNRSFGFVFQNPQLIGSLSVLDNVLVPALLARKRGLEPKAEKLLKDLGLKNRLSYLPYQLSIGQKRRVAVARALLLDPVVVFADEPTNDLDPERAAWIGEYLMELPKAGGALILATHDVRPTGKAGRVVQIVEGEVSDLPIGELKAG
jgi:ABC-type lipoprotein export system ATPase subunit